MYSIAKFSVTRAESAVWRRDQRDSRRLNHIRTWTLWWKANQKAFRAFLQGHITTFNSGNKKFVAIDSDSTLQIRNYHLWGLMAKKNIHIFKSYKIPFSFPTIYMQEAKFSSYCSTKTAYQNWLNAEECRSILLSKILQKCKTMPLIVSENIVILVKILL